ncbi:hypothetical protein RTH46_23545 [Pseudomonas sp. zfem004]|uniref:hypothetical protein n=1 Tax=Pseudomonas sp. zfem004 TaxID=3078199 RepID=UPI0029277ADE|nr:hypothetical protein [Pseudomonas sp. zfem004]MDU9405463.1 hypothetical protein [Pseudomonas sp. zfem004]
MLKVLKFFLAIPPVLAYLFFCYLATRGGELTLLQILRHVILVTGFVPLCSWLLVIFKSTSATIFKSFVFALLITIYHVFLFAVSAHRDGLYYWGVQLFEFAGFYALIRIVNGARVFSGNRSKGG